MEAIGKPLSVFLVDDDKMFLLSLKYRLMEQFKNIKFFTYASGEECWEHIDNKPDIVILDYYMNTISADAMNGIEVLKKIKNNFPDIKVVMLSAQDKLEVAIDSIKYGAYEYVVKSESAFVRLQNAMKNIIHGIVSSRENKKYEVWNYLIGIFFVVLVVLDVLYYIMR